MMATACCSGQSLAVADGSMITHHTMTRRPAVPYEESVESTGLPHEDIIFSSMSSQVLAQVLRRLPARTLGRLKCVCRTWRAIIGSGRFIRLHYEHTCRSSLARVALSSMPYDWQFASLDSCPSNLRLAWRMQELQRRVASIWETEYQRVWMSALGRMMLCFFLATESAVQSEYISIFKR